MRINLYVSSFVFLNALAAYAGEGTAADSASLTRDKTEKGFWVMRIKVPVGSDYFIKTSNTTQQIDDDIENPDDFTAFGDTAAVVPFDERLDTTLDDDEKKVTTEYHVVAQMTWNATNATTIGGRGFWVGRGKDQKLLQDLEKVSVVSFERIALTHSSTLSSREIGQWATSRSGSVPISLTSKHTTRAVASTPNGFSVWEEAKV